jgi:hypothetical protein
MISPYTNAKALHVVLASQCDIRNRLADITTLFWLETAGNNLVI